jgi:hypothetical protein
MNHKLEMVKAYIRGSLRGTPAGPDLPYMQGYEAALQSLQEYIGKLEYAIETAGKKNEDS